MKTIYVLITLHGGYFVPDGRNTIWFDSFLSCQIIATGLQDIEYATPPQQRTEPREQHLCIEAAHFEGKP